MKINHSLIGVLILIFISLHFIENRKVVPKKYMNATEIIDNLWVGDHISASDRTFINDNNIKLIINLSKDIRFASINNVELVRVPIDDDLSLQSDIGMVNYFGPMYNNIDKALRENKGVLIHCWAGMQRSATLCALYIMRKKNKKFSEVKNIIQEKRPICFTPGVNFKRSLMYFDNQYCFNS